MQTKLEKLPYSRIRLTVTLSGDEIQKYYALAVQKVGQSIEIKGFRKGHAPKAMIIQRTGNRAVLHEMLELALPDTYYKAIKERKQLIPVAQPAIDVEELKDLDKGQVPTEIMYTAEVDIMPEVIVGDYKKIRVKSKKASEKVETKEIDETVVELKKVYGDEYLKAGNFKDEAEMRRAVEENIKQQKIIEAKTQTYDAIIEEVIKKAKVEVPETFVHNEIHRMEQQIELQAKAYNMTFDDWLKRENKTHEDIHKEWRPQSEKAAKVGLVLGKIAEEEKIDPTKSDASRLVLEKLYAYATGEKAAN